MTGSAAPIFPRRLPLDERPALIACAVDVDLPAARAFELFTTQTGRWWPFGPGGNSRRRRQIIVEPHAKGRMYEVHADGAVGEWAIIVAYVPPRSLIVEWLLDADFAMGSAPSSTDVELFFADNRDGTSHVTVIHTRLERLGGEPEAAVEKLRLRWREVLHAFQACADTVDRRLAGRARRPSPRRRSPVGIL